MKTNLPPLEPIVKIGGSVFAVRGDLSFVSGPPKSGKTAVCAAMLASLFTKSADIEGDLLGFEAAPADGRPVVYVDTEQPKQYTKQLITKVMELTRLQQEPTNLFAFNIRELNTAERRQFLEQLFSEMENEFLYFIDGITDFLDSVNDESASSEFINFLMRISSRKQIPIIGVVHENPGNGKLRGHIGSEAERKCGGAIAIRKDREKGVHWIEPKMLRGTNDFTPIYFQWHPEKKRFCLASDGVTKYMENERLKTPEERKKEKITSLFSNVFGAEKELEKKTLVARITALQSCSEKTAERRISDGVELGVLAFCGERKSFQYL